MAGLTIYCPFCGQRAGIHTTEKLSLLVTKARIYCPSCGQLNADFVGQISNIKRAVYVDCPEERLAQLKGQGKSQGKLF